jgi:hypothetical protein
MLFHHHQVSKFVQKYKQETVLPEIGIKLNCRPGSMPNAFKTPKPGAAWRCNPEKEMIFAEKWFYQAARLFWKAQKNTLKCFRLVGHSQVADTFLLHDDAPGSTGIRSGCDLLKPENGSSFSGCCNYRHNL